MRGEILPIRKNDQRYLEALQVGRMFKSPELQRVDKDAILDFILMIMPEIETLNQVSFEVLGLDNQTLTFVRRLELNRLAARIFGAERGTEKQKQQLQNQADGDVFRKISDVVKALTKQVSDILPSVTQEVNEQLA